MYLPFTKFSNKFHNFQAMSQHLSNKQDVNILKHTCAYLISMKLIMTYKTGQNLIQKNNNLYSRSCSKDFHTKYISLNIFLDIARTIIFTMFMVRGLDTDDFPFHISGDVLGY